MVCNRVGGVGMAYSEWKNDAGQHQIQKKKKNIQKHIYHLWK
jgi:hypothetical protein